MSESSATGNDNRLAVETFEVFRDTPVGLARIAAAYDLENPNTAANNQEADEELDKCAAENLDSVLRGAEPDIDTAIEAIEWWHRTDVTQKVGRHALRQFAKRQDMEVAGILHGAIITATQIDWSPFDIAKQSKGLRSTNVHEVTGSFHRANTRGGVIFLKDSKEARELGEPNRPGPGEFWRVPFMTDGQQTANITIVGNQFTGK